MESGRHGRRTGSESARPGWRYAAAFAAIFIALGAGSLALRTSVTAASLPASEDLPILATVPHGNAPHGNMASADAAGVVYGFYVASMPDPATTRAPSSHPTPTTSAGSVVQPPSGSD